MAMLVIVVGIVITLWCFVNGIAVSPESAIQQQVQELRFAEAVLGLIVVAIGLAIHKLDQIRRRLPEANYTVLPIHDAEYEAHAEPTLTQ